MLQRKWLWAVIYCGCKMCVWRDNERTLLCLCWSFAFDFFAIGCRFIVISSIEGCTCKPGGSCILLVLVLLGVIVIELDSDDRLLRAEEGRDDDRPSANKQQKQKIQRGNVNKTHTYRLKKKPQRINEWSCNVSAVDTKLGWLRARWWTAHPSQSRKQTLKRQRRRTVSVTP